MKKYEIIHGDCVTEMSKMPTNSIDSIVCDPPYELGFMSKAWDATGIANSVEMWREALRVLKPGGHLLAFSGSRTYHRMTCAIEDAGFEVRDQILWVYGSGFPKSHNVGKALGDLAVEQLFKGGGTPAVEASKAYEGWGTALKPAHEPICVARKPLIGTMAANVLAHGTGALNIDGCRVETSDNLNGGAYSETRQESISEWAASGSLHESTGQAFVQPAGRWPANLIHDGSNDVVALFPAQAGAAAAVKGTEPSAASTGAVTGQRDRVAGAFHADSGSAARFFYCAKASKSDRNEGLDDFEARTETAHRRTNLDTADNPYLRAKTERLNTHPTVKPTDLMAYLVRLVTPPGGLVLDPFMGSGSTGKACMREDFRFIGIELDAGYLEIAESRITAELAVPKQASLL